MRDAVLFLAPVVLAMPFIVGAIARQSDIGAFRFVLGWSEARFGDGPAAVAFFYLTNLGIPVLLAVIAAFTARGLPWRWFLVGLDGRPVHRPERRRGQRRRVRHEQVLPDHVDRGRDPGRLAAQALAAGAIVAVLLVSRSRRRSSPPGTCARTIVALTCPQERAARWIAANTPERAVFVTDAFINSPVDLAGRLRISTFGPYVVEPGLRPGAASDGHQGHLLRRSRRSRAERMADYGATYVLSSGGDPCAMPAGAGRTSARAPRVRDRLRPMTASAVWRLARRDVEPAQRARASPKPVSPWARRRS